GRESRKRNLLPGHVGGKSNIASLIDPRAAGTGCPREVEQPASRRRIARANDARNLISLVRLEDTRSQTDIALTGNADTLVCRNDARKDKISSVVQAGVEADSSKLPTTRGGSHLRN